MNDGWRRLLRVWRREPADEVDAELQFHFDERVADLVGGGMSADAARAQTVVACLIPAWRALRVDPLVALRAE